MNGIYELLEAIRKRPAMYLGRPSISLLEAYLHGYCAGMQSHGLTASEALPFAAFNSWVIARLYPCERNSLWGWLILRACDGNEERAFDRFFEFLDEYRVRQERILRCVTLPVASTPKTKKVLHSDGRFYRHAPEGVIQLVEYVGQTGVLVRHTDLDGNWRSEFFEVDLEDALRHAEERYGIRSDDWQFFE